MLNVYTFYTDESRIQYLKESSKLNDVNVNYIKNEKWNGYVDKIIAIKNVIENLKDDDIVCFIDAYDVLVNNTYLEILDRFKSCNCEVLLGAELNCYPDIYINRFPNTTTKYKYINSGGYIGYKRAIQKIFEWKSMEEIYNICRNGGDQTYFIEYYLNNMNENIKLDDRCIIFQNMHLVSWKEFTFNYGKFTNNILNIIPCFIHFNGGTWQQNNRENIMPIFIDKMNTSLKNNCTLDLNDYNQIITSTCYPHSQI
jgi:hypothetical protein